MLQQTSLFLKFCHICYFPLLFISKNNILDSEELNILEVLDIPCTDCQWLLMSLEEILMGNFIKDESGRKNYTS